MLSSGIAERLFPYQDPIGRRVFLSENKDYYERLRSVIEQVHNCSAEHFASRRITEVYKGQVVWEGLVETFNLKGHPKASKCYSWRQGKNGEEIATALNIRPIHTPADAIRAHLSLRNTEKENHKPTT